MSEFEDDKDKLCQQEANNQEKDPIPSVEDRTNCVRCGEKILADQLFCPKCGHKVGEPAEEVPRTTHRPISKKIIYISIGVLIVLFFCSIAFIVLKQNAVVAKQITLNKKELTIKVGEQETLTYTIDPENTKNKEVVWKSSNESIVKVSGGTVTAVNEGSCTISVATQNDKFDICNITVKPAAPDLKKIYSQYCKDSYAAVAEDGSYLTIDTNPLDVDDYFNTEAMAAIKTVNQALGIPESVMRKMEATRALDGMQTYDGEQLEISWTYHPNNGLQVQYSLCK